MSPTLRTLLLVSTRRVWPALDGIQLRQAALLRHLRSQWRVVIASPDDPAEIDASCVDEHRALNAPARWHPAPDSHWGGPAPADLDRLLQPLDPAAMLFWVGAERLGFGRPSRWPAAVVDRIDAMSLYTLREIRRRAPFVRRQDLTTLATYLAYERRVVRSYSHTVVVAPDDCRLLRRLSGRNQVEVIPNGVDTQPVQGGEHAVPTVMFSGVMDYSPNVLAVAEFARTVWPLIHTAHPSARFVVAGRRPHPDIQALHGVMGIEVTGEVADMHALQREAWVIVAPMRSGAGIKNKVLEGWSAGRPVVMTSLATNGLVPCAEASDLVVDDPQAMATRIGALLGSPDERRRIGNLLHQHVAAHHSWASAAASLSDVIEHAIEQARSAVPKALVSVAAEVIPQPPHGVP